MLLRRLKAKPITIHGFRSAFRDWAGDETDFPRELAEAALAHAVGDAVERAYRRSDALERRRPLMNAWGTTSVEPQTRKLSPLSAGSNPKPRWVTANQIDLPKIEPGSMPSCDKLDARR